MQQVMVNIENKELEKMLLDEANKKGRKLANIILEVLENTFLQKRERRLPYKRLDPLTHMSKISYDIEEIAPDDDLSDVTPFEGIEDSASYIRELRKNAWRK